MKILLLSSFIFIAFLSHAQNSYRDSIEKYQEEYVNTHEVVKGNDRTGITFFPVDEKLRITARFERKTNSPWFLMEASGPDKRNYRVYGIIHFKIHDTLVTLNIYQSQSLMMTDKYRDHLFIPFTDATSGEESYSGGRYIDLEIGDIKGNSYKIDFNKAYNPYCAYVSEGYSCPLPPKENQLNVMVRAGEKEYNAGK